LENDFTHKQARNYIDLADEKVDEEAVGMLRRLRDSVVLGEGSTKEYNIPWGPSITIQTHADYLRQFAGISWEERRGERRKRERRGERRKREER
jgi:hypothetical protein